MLLASWLLSPGPQVEELTHVPHVYRELMLVKVSCPAHARGELVSLATVRRLRCVRGAGGGADGWDAPAGIAFLHTQFADCLAGLLLLLPSPLTPPPPPTAADLPGAGVRRERQHGDPGGDGQAGQDAGAEGGAGALW